MNSYLKLLADDDDDEMENQYGIGWSSNHTSGGISKFKSITPPSLPTSQPPFSPSFFCIPPGLSPTVLLDSPVLFPTNIFPSPTTGSFSAQSINWSGNSSSYQHGIKEEETSYSDFSFQPIKMPAIAAPSLFQSSSAFSTMEEAMEGQQSPWKYHEPTDIMQFSASKNRTDDYYIAPTQPISSSNIPTIRPKVESHSGQLPDFKNPSQVPHYLREQRRSDDGYNWRKYGQKQVKASENPRSYYKCTYPNCPTKKKVERSLLDGRITKIEFIGTHNHPKPHYSRKTSTSSQAIQAPNALQVSDHSLLGCSASQTDSVGTSNNSSISLGDGDFSQNSERCKLEEEYDEDEPDVKRWKEESESEIISAFGNRTLKEPKVVVQTTSDVDILDDGYRWRKYGQKVVKGNTNPRNYYKCTFPGCTVRKHVERAPQDLRDVITTYEGKHNHGLPTGRGRGSRTIDSPFADNVDKNSHSDNDDNIYIPDFQWM